jgi:hypothetical protein
MKLLRLSLNVHENTSSGKEVIINSEYIVSMRERHYTSGNYTEIAMVNNQQFHVKETIRQIEKMLGSKKWL